MFLDLYNKTEQMEYPKYESSREMSLCIPMEDITSADIHSLIEERVSKEVVSYHNGEGIVIPESVSVLTRSPLLLNPKDSTYRVIVRYSAVVTDTPNGAEVSAVVESVISSGLICHVYDSRLPNPLIRVYVPIMVHTEADRERIAGILKNDIIRVRSINRKGSYADTIITMIGVFVDLVSRPDVVPDVPDVLPAPADESEYDARGDGDPLGPHADGMSIDPPGEEGEGEGGPPDSSSGGSKYVNLTTLIKAKTSEEVPNVYSISLFKMQNGGYKDFSKYVNGIADAIKIVSEYLLKEKFIIHLYIDDSIERDENYTRIFEMCRDAEFVELIKFDAPDFRHSSGVGHLSTFGTLVRLLPLFEYGTVLIRDTDVKYTAGQEYGDLYEFLRDDKYDIMAYTNNYNPHHLKRIGKGRHGRVFGAGSVASKRQFDKKMFDSFLENLLDTNSKLYKEIVIPTVENASEGKKKAIDLPIFYGVDEILLNNVLLQQVAEDRLKIVYFYDEAYYLVNRIVKRGKIPQGEKIIRAFRKLKSDVDKQNFVRRLVGKDDEYNKNYDIKRTYENVML